MIIGESFFYENTWDKFKPRQNLSLLLEEDVDLFYRQKQISFCAVSAWLIGGRKSGLIKHAVCMGITSALIAAEREAAVRVSQTTKSPKELNLALLKADPPLETVGLTGSMAVPIITGPEFFVRAYWPIGGLATLARSHSTGDHGRALKRQMPLRASLEMMRALHLAHERLPIAGSHELSVAKAARAVTVIRLPKLPASYQLERYWQSYKNRIALLYSAGALKIDDGRTLLDEMERYYPRLDMCEKHLLRWLGMASFVLDILERCPVQRDSFFNPMPLSSLNRRSIPKGIAPIPFPVQHNYSASQIERIVDTFEKKRGRPAKSRS